MKRRLVSAFAVIALTLLFMKVFGSIRFTDGMTTALVQAADWFGVHGVEGIEDFYLLISAIVALTLSLLIVSIAHTTRKRRPHRP